MTARAAFLTIHRYLGLLLAGFLVVSGISGSILAFYAEFDALFNPEFFRIHERGQAILDPQSLVSAIETSDPRIRVFWLPLEASAKRAQVAYIEPERDPLTHEVFDVSYDEVFINPVTAEITGSRKWGECCQRVNFVPLIHKLHNRLLLPASVGRPIWGLVAILWTIMALIGFALTFPGSRPVLSRWKSAWTLKRGLPFVQGTFRLHRAIGLWFWLVILTLAITGISLALDRQLFRPMLEQVSTFSETVWDERTADTGNGSFYEGGEPRISFTAALTTARSHMRESGLNRQPRVIEYSDSRGLYRIAFGISNVFVDSRSGEVLGAALTDNGTLADVVDGSTQALHAGRIFGLPGRIIVFIAGWAVALLSVTGVILWWKRRSIRKASR
jgi:uncharacterized iron-regulated membrane protein